MEDIREVVIHQTLHGYSNGHSLLASSCELSVEEKKTLLIMSDSSGSSNENSFSTYLTGYPLSGGKYYALARTWSATEMSRPGCVWTHTLLIDFTLLSRLRKLGNLSDLFVRPNLENYSNYNSVLSINSVLKGQVNFDNTDSEIQDILRISYILYGEPKKGIVISSNASSTFEQAILGVWSQQWPRLRRTFSFCTGSLSLRTLNGNLLDLQVIPSNRERATASKYLKDIVLVNASIVRGIPVNLLEQYAFEYSDELLHFMYKFGSEIEGGRAKFIPLLLAYKFYKGQGQFNLVELIEFFDLYFSSPNEAKTLKKEIILSEIEKDPKKGYSLLLYLLTPSSSKSLSNINLDVLSRIKKIWRGRYISINELQNILEVVDPNIFVEGNINFLAELPLQSWIHLDWIRIDIIRQIIREKPEVVSDKFIWEASNEIQDQWIDALVDVDNVDKKELVKSLLVHDNEYVVHKVVKNFGTSSIDIALDWANINGELLNSKWEDEVKEVPNSFFKWLSIQKTYSKYILSLATKLFSPSNEKLIQVDTHVWVKLIDNLKVNYQIGDVLNIYSFILSASLKNNLKDSSIIIAEVFQLVHDAAEMNYLDNKSWNLILPSLDKKLNSLPATDSLFKILRSKVDTVPNWDRCEMLRRNLVNAFIIFQWDEVTFIKSIKKESTFERIVHYCAKTPRGQSFIKKVSYHLNDKLKKIY